MPKSYKRLVLNLDEAEYAALKQEAAKRGITITAMVRGAIAAASAAAPLPPPGRRSA